MREKIVKGIVRSAFTQQYLRFRHSGIEERVAIEFPYFGGLTYRAVAEELELREGTIESRIRNGWAASERWSSMRSPISMRSDSPPDSVDLAGELDRKETRDRRLTVSPELHRAGQLLIDRDETFICDETATTTGSFVFPDRDAGL
jgi:hypothetical protein